MRITKLAPVLACMALAACGSGADEAGNGEGMSSEQVAAEMEDAVRLTPGQYETQVEMLELAIAGMSDEQTKQMREMMSGEGAMSSSFCLTPEEAAEGPERMVQEMADADCVFNEFDVSGGAMTADMQCASAEGIEGHYQIEGEMTAESSVMTMRVEQQLPGVGGGEASRMEMRVTSRRIGDCA